LKHEVETRSTAEERLMIDDQHVLKFLGIVVVACPMLLTVVLGVSSLMGWKLSEQRTAQVIYVPIMTGLAASVLVLGWMLISGDRDIRIDVGEWVEMPHYHFSIKFVFDRLSVPMAILSYVLSGTIGVFATKYMHREGGYNRFFMLYSIFVLGMVMTSLAATIETLFTGWELVGLSSALLVAFFQERPNPSRNGLWIWIIYRFSDAALLLAAVAMHHLSGEGDFDKLLGAGSWPYETSTLPSRDALLVGLLLLIAASGKSALVPFSGWLPRAMEGPTPSSAVFYGALSVHLGAFLLLRVSPLLDRSTILCVAIIAVGLTSAVFAYLAGSVQTDIKSALSFASLSQVGIIVAEIGFGLRYIPLFHLLSHASLRTLQFVRAPSLLHDYRTLEDAIGTHLPRSSSPWRRIGKSKYWDYLYRFGLDRGYLDAFLKDYLVHPFVRGLSWCDSLERRWTDFLAGGVSRESDRVKPHIGTIEELS
jgi:NADH-quinone oxidoreductase subunit L